MDGAAAIVCSKSLRQVGISFSGKLVQAYRVDEQLTDDEPLLGRAALTGVAVFTALVLSAGVILLPPVAALATAVLACLMALITLIDFRHYIIPNVLSYPAVPIGLLANVAVFFADDWRAGLADSVLGAVLAGGSFYLLRAVWFRLRGTEGLGLGDVKLAAVAGAWLGPALLPSVCLVSSLTGLAAVGLMALTGRRPSLGDHIPFGSFIAPVILLFWIARLWQAVSFW